MNDVGSDLDLPGSIDLIAADTGFSGVVRVDSHAACVFERAYGERNRAEGLANTVDTRFAIASGSKGMTALAVVGLIDDGLLALTTTARSVLGDDLPLIDDEVTVEQLLGHRSGIGDYLSEDEHSDITEYVLAVPVHQLATTEGFLPILDHHPTEFAPGERFSYNNGGYVVLALIAERVTRVTFHDLVEQRVCDRAGMTNTAFLRTDELPSNAAINYLAADGLRTNLLHLPVRGNGDGGIYSTAADIHAMWEAFFAGRIVSEGWVVEMVRPRSDSPVHHLQYGLGFWLGSTSADVLLEGYDAGVSFRSVHDPGRALTHTVISNTTDGAWAVCRRIRALLDQA